MILASETAPIPEKISCSTDSLMKGCRLPTYLREWPDEQVCQYMDSAPRSTASAETRGVATTSSQRSVGTVGDHSQRGQGRNGCTAAGQVIIRDVALPATSLAHGEVDRIDTALANASPHGLAGERGWVGEAGEDERLSAAGRGASSALFPSRCRLEKGLDIVKKILGILSGSTKCRNRRGGERTACGRSTGQTAPAACGPPWHRLRTPEPER